MIDLRSDTLSLPTMEMRNVICNAVVGDNLYNDDYETLELEKYCCDLFSSESAIFVNSGFLANQIAIRCHTTPGDELITESGYHINMYESGPTSDLGKVNLNLITTTDGILRVSDIEKAINSKYRSELYSKPKLILLENTINSYGGKVYELEDLMEIYKFAKERGIKVHIDGARIMNACIARNVSPSEYMQYADSISMSFSKGLGAPFGAVLVGNNSIINKAKTFNKWYGGGLHQSGFMSAAAHYAIKNNLSQINLDHQNAKLLAQLISDIEGLEVVNRVETNIVMFKISKSTQVSAAKFIDDCRRNGVHLYLWNETTIRAVTCINISQENIIEVSLQLKKLASYL